MPEQRQRRGLGRLLRDTLSYGMGSVAVRAGQVLLIPVLTRALSPTGYGLLDLDTSTMLFVAMALALGLDAATWRFYFEVDDDRQRRSILVSALYTQLAVSLLVTGLLALTAPLWVQPLIGQPGQADNVRIILCAVPCSVALGTFTTVLRARFMVARANVLAVLQLGCVAGANVAAIALHHGDLHGVVASTAAGYAVATAAGVALLGRDLLGRWSWGWTRTLLGYGLPLVPASIALWSLPVAGRFIMSHLGGAGDVALLALAGKLVALIGLAMSAFQFAWGPFAMSIARQADARAVYARALAYVVAGGVCLTAALSVVADPLLRVVSTGAYAGAARLIPWLGLGAVATGAYYVTQIGASIAKKPGLIAWSLLAGAGVNLALAAALAPLFGAEGVAAASFAGLAVAAWLPAVLGRRHVAVDYTLRGVLPLLAVATAIAFAGGRILVTPRAADVLLRLAMLGALAVCALVAARRAGLVAVLQRRLRRSMASTLSPVSVATTTGAE